MAWSTVVARVTMAATLAAMLAAFTRLPGIELAAPEFGGRLDGTPLRRTLDGCGRRHRR